MTEHGFDFKPLLDLLDNAIYVDKKLTVNYPSPEVACRLKTLIERAEGFEEVQKEYGEKRLSEISETVVADVVSSIGMYLDPQSSELHGGQFLASFRDLPVDTQLLRWGEWMEMNPFQVELDWQLELPHSGGIPRPGGPRTFRDFGASRKGKPQAGTAQRLELLLRLRISATVLIANVNYSHG